MLIFLVISTLLLYACNAFKPLRAGFGLSNLDKTLYTRLLADSSDSNENAGSTDLTGYSLWVTASGMGFEQFNFAVQLGEGGSGTFSNGLTSSKPGFWRSLSSDGKTYVEVTHPLTAEHMFLLELDEPTVLWRGELSSNSRQLTDGTCVANKKRFGLFSFPDTIATFNARLYAPGEPLKSVELPKFSDLRFTAPDGFYSPADMKRYPEYFDPDFVKDIYQREEALLNGQEPPARSKNLWVPKPDAKASENDNEPEEMSAAAQAFGTKRKRKNAKKKDSGFS
jgi:hypothetical protein